MRQIRWLVVHTSATADKHGNPVDATLESMRAYHMDHNGWPDIGYHWVIRMNGDVDEGLPLETIGMHVGGFNTDSIGICCSGHGDIAPLTPRQFGALVDLLVALCERFKLSSEAVLGHNETDDHGGPPVAKTCPGLKVDMRDVRSAVKGALYLKAQVPAAPTRRGVAPTEPFPLSPTSDQRLAALERRVAALEARTLPFGGARS